MRRAQRAACRARARAQVRATWLLARAGYTQTRRERAGGRVIVSWKLPAKAVGATAAPEASAPLPYRQQLEESEPGAFLPPEELTTAHTALLGTLQSVADAAANKFSPATLDDASALPVILVSHTWRSPEHADPRGETLKQVAAQLARDLPIIHPWGVEDVGRQSHTRDARIPLRSRCPAPPVPRAPPRPLHRVCVLLQVGVFLDWCCLPQETPAHPRTPEQAQLTTRALNQMGLWFSHTRTTVYLARATEEDVQGKVVPLPPLEPPREERGWPYFEEAVVELFKVRRRARAHKHSTRAAHARPGRPPPGAAPALSLSQTPPRAPHPSATARTPRAAERSRVPAPPGRCPR